jgi:2-dehydro-3-deoxyphosphogluconate aldolase / (4S)-4-hydroxy-2-oxoglutarate aldolase
MDLARFRNKPLMGILRGIKAIQLKPLVETIVASGLETIEITLNTPHAPELISRARKLSQGRLVIGAGTVLDLDGLKSALDSGASFIVMPVLIKEVLRYCVKKDIPAFPGALTPQEIYNAWDEGATMVKVFPAKFFGPGYFKEIKGPFNDIELMACSGVPPDNLREYFSCGASAATFGSSVFRKEWLDAGDYKSVSRLIKAYLRQIN